MHFSQLGVMAALAVADAFLLPPKVSAADSDIIKALSFEDTVAIDGRVLEMNCLGCPVVKNIGDTFKKLSPSQVNSVLKLDFRVVHGEEDRLYLNNGRQIYPPSDELFTEPLTAYQMIKKSDNTWENSSTPIQITSWGTSVERLRHTTNSNEDQLGLLLIRVEIRGVAFVFPPMKTIVEIKLLETASHNLMIGDAIITEELQSSMFSIPHGPTKPTDDGQECITLLCKWRAIVADRLSKLKGCGSKASQAVHVVPAHKTHGHHDRPHKGHRPNGSHRPYRHHHRHGGLTRFLKGIVMHVVIPVLVGFMVGITAFLVGMVVGQLIIFVWRAIFRRGQRSQYVKVQQEGVGVEDVTDETKGLMEDQGPPPVYEEVIVVEKSSE